ncbi:hypothetical protein GYMLUDRAFT_50339 [Collybiopsis luxurians FD-317 M1]|uniref:Uncharacterized protein n=1 Tax=Collybiopsis luxurians FD-317 M1 TaxID=944289 RepID=A0A0D0ANE8_9AGAR|nr:hypothetical protein GYMLUDRAFT_50339 [Collybiopsis luxurians FD-317 M1]
MEKVSREVKVVSIEVSIFEISSKGVSTTWRLRMLPCRYGVAISSTSENGKDVEIG